MRLRVINDFGLLDSSIIRKAARYYAARLLGDRADDIHVTIRFKEIPKYKAYCTYSDGMAKPRRFVIVMDVNMGLRKTLEILAHEMVHVKQYVKGELRDYVYGNHVRWQGQKMFYDDDDDEAYFESPWEIEAYGRQIGLYVGFRREFLGNEDH